MVIYPAVSNLSNCTDRLPAVDAVFSFKYTKSASATDMRMDITANLNWECNNGFSGRNIGIHPVFHHLTEVTGFLMRCLTCHCMAHPANTRPIRQNRMKERIPYPIEPFIEVTYR